ncbi:hypothetical protein BC826DRAFT_1022936 [Russula brevipes]|nr:hypothetical protein BC826DRAFT_1022936 [Russula brevipes]
MCNVPKDEMVERLLAFKAKASLAHSFVLSSSSPASKGFQYALHDAFSDSFEKRRNKPAEMVARHIDELMRKGQGSASDESFIEQLWATALPSIASRQTSSTRSIIEPSQSGSYSVTAPVTMRKRPRSRSSRGVCIVSLPRNRCLLFRILNRLFSETESAEYDPEFGMGDHMF